MIKVIPAILPSSYKELEDTLERFRGVVTSVQIDVVDGHFAPNKTWPYTKEGEIEFEKIVNQENGMPFWQEFDFEFDCMVSDALREVPRFLQAGATRLVVHTKSTGAREAMALIQHLRGDGRGFISLGVGLAAHDSPDALRPFDGLYDFVQVMGIEKVGFQSQPFDTRALALILQLRAAHPELQISIDGGVRMENIQALVEAGATRLVVGSLILSQSDVKQAIHEIIAAANHTRAG